MTRVVKATVAKDATESPSALFTEAPLPNVRKVRAKVRTAPGGSFDSVAEACEFANAKRTAAELRAAVTTTRGWGQ